MCVGLIGQYGLVSYTLRQAQRLIRLDRTASYWSHAFLVRDALSDNPSVNRNPLQSPWIQESTLDPSPAFSSFVERYGVSARPIADYTRVKFDPFEPHCTPNMAIIAIGLTSEERDKIAVRADNPYVDQLNYDFPSLLGLWYSYITSRGEIANPLIQGHPMAGAAYLQFAYDAAAVDLAPGSRQRNIAPEHIWQAAKRLNPTFKAIAEARTIERPVVGWYCVRDRACVSAPVEETTPFPLTVSGCVEAIKRRGPGK